MILLKLYIKQSHTLFDFMWKKDKLNTVASSMYLPWNKTERKNQVETGAQRKVYKEGLYLSSDMPVFFNHSNMYTKLA